MAQRSGKRAPRSQRGGAGDGARPVGKRELVVMVNAQTGLRASARGIAAAAGVNVRSLSALLASAHATMRPLFGEAEERLQAKRASMAAAGVPEAPDLSIYYRVEVADDQLDALRAKLGALPAVAAAYVKPAAEPPMLTLNMAPSPAEPPAATPDFSGRQAYLDPAPGGIDARHAWTRPGGGGAGVGIVDIEGEWRFTHEDLQSNQGGVVGGTPPGDLLWRNHGTAVVGAFGGDRNGFGITGICPDANVRAISVFGAMTSSAAIRTAADMLNPGDIILIELHRPGPRFNYANRADQRGYIPIEWWPDDYDAIRYAVGRGVIVVEAAGNGAENLDDAIYGAPAQGFPATWSNPFARGARDSGAILVGAGAPPPGTHGRNHGPDRSRLDFSNFGAAVDVQGWGEEVTTSGYGTLQGGTNEDLWYTDQFNGTSSASPIVVGALACMQGVLRAGSRPVLTAATARALLRSTGSAQQDAPARPAAQRIGNRPDLRVMIDGQVVAAARVPVHRYWHSVTGHHFYTTDWNELGGGGFGWSYEGVQCHALAAAQAGTVPLHRYYHPATGAHFYTTNWNELGAGNHGWVHEGTACHVYPSAQAGATPLYRYWNGAVGDHFYTINWGELGNGRFGWVYEGIQCWVFAAAAGAPPAFAVAAAPEEALRPAPPPVLTLSAPGWTRSGQAGAVSTGKDAYVQTAAGIVHVTVRIER
jgi:hypothetical protein